MIQSVSVTFTGNGTNYIGTRLRGRIHAVKIVADSNVTNSFILALTGETTAVPILANADVANDVTTWCYPRQLATKGTDGSAATDAFVQMVVFNERIQCVTASAGITGEITITVFYDSEE